MAESRECFVISPIGEPGSDVRKKSDQVLEYVIEDAISEYGYHPVRADEISQPGIITTQIIQRVLDAPLVIADLTGHNANVFYELAVRHAARRPIIQLIESDQEIPFDIANTRTVHFTLSDVEAYENAKQEIQDQIEIIEEENDEIDNPISAAIDLQLWRESGDPHQENMADVMERITELQSSIRAVERLVKAQRLSSPGMKNMIENMESTQSELEAAYSGFGDMVWDSMIEEDKDQFKKVGDLISELGDQLIELRENHIPDEVSFAEFKVK